MNGLLTLHFCTVTNLKLLVSIIVMRIMLIVTPSRRSTTRDKTLRYVANQMLKYSVTFELIPESLLHITDSLDTTKITLLRFKSNV